MKNLSPRNRPVSRKRAPRRRGTPPPQVEPLEERCLLDGSPMGPFRPIDEVGNNVNNPTWGAAPADQPGEAAIDLLRLSDVAYADGISKPSMGGGTPTFVASPRTVSNDVSNQATTLFGPQDVNTVDGNGLSDFGYVWGQFLDHDMDLTPDGGAAFNIPADPTHPDDPIQNLLFTRSQTDPTTGPGTGNPLQQINTLTAYLDLSQVYGSKQAVADALRTFSGGRLKSSPGADGITGTADDLLPYNDLTYFNQGQLDALNMANDAHLVDPSQLFAAGDVRANENLELTALQTLFMRNHNLIAGELQAEHTDWTDEQLYQEARKLNIAEEQMITYDYYLPDLLGPAAAEQLAYTGYDPTVNASIATEFSTVAFRFGHSLLNNDVRRDNNDGSPVGGTTLQLAQDFFDPNLLAPGGVVDPFTGLVSTDIGAVLKGDADGTAQAMDVMAVNSVRNLLFGDGSGGGQDLIARDIWRAHDDGIGTYNQVVAGLNSLPGFNFNLPLITNDATQGFDQLTSNPTLQQELATAYNSKAGFQANGKTAGDIDPFAAGLAQDHVPGSDLGPLFTDILIYQFSQLEKGDRFFYANESFSPDEQAILNEGNTLAKIIAANTDVTLLQSDVFLNPTLSQQNAVGKGFFTNKNGEAALTGSQTGTTLSSALYNALFAPNTGLLANGPTNSVLVDAAGAPVPLANFLSYSFVKDFLQNAAGGNLANMLSAQLLTTEFDVLLDKVDATTSIYVPAVTVLGTGQPLSSTLQNSLIAHHVSTASGVANIQNVLDAAIAELASATPDSTFREALKDSLDGINNNESIFIV